MGVPHLRSASALGQQQQQLAQARQQLGQAPLSHQQQQQQQAPLQQQQPPQYSSLQPPPNPSNPENPPVGGPVSHEFGPAANFAKHFAMSSPDVLLRYSDQFRNKRMELEAKIQSLLPRRPETQTELEQSVKAREHFSGLEALISQIQMRRASASGYVFYATFPSYASNLRLAIVDPKITLRMVVGLRNSRPLRITPSLGSSKVYLNDFPHPNMLPSSSSIGLRHRSRLPLRRQMSRPVRA